MTELEETIIEWDRLAEKLAERQIQGLRHFAIPKTTLSKNFEEENIKSHLERLNYCVVDIDDSYSVIYWDGLESDEAIREAIAEEDEKFFPLAVIIGGIMLVILLGVVFV